MAGWTATGFSRLNQESVLRHTKAPIELLHSKANKVVYCPQDQVQQTPITPAMLGVFARAASVAFPFYSVWSSYVFLLESARIAEEMCLLEHWQQFCDDMNSRFRSWRIFW